MPTAEELAQSQTTDTTPDAAALGNIVNAAVTAHLKRANIGKTISDAIEAAMKPVREQLEKPAAVAETPKADPKASPEFAAAMRELESVKATLRTESDARGAAEKRQREDRAYQDLRAGLQTAGLKPEMVDVAAKVLFHADSRISFDENGTALFRHTKSTPGYGDEDEFLPLSAGIAAYAKSKDAEPFLPAPTAAKSAQIPRGTTRQAPQVISQLPPAVTDDDKISRAMANEALLAAQFPNS